MTAAEKQSKQAFSVFSRGHYLFFTSLLGMWLLIVLGLVAALYLGNLFWMGGEWWHDRECRNKNLAKCGTRIRLWPPLRCTCKWPPLRSKCK